MAARVEVKDDGCPIQLRLDLILNIAGADQYTAEITGHTASIATPHANGGSPS